MEWPRFRHLSRVAALEREVAVLRQELAAKTDDNWLARIAGTEVDDEAFREAMEHGRAFRQAADEGANGQP